jgi:hypothetical protein
MNLNENFDLIQEEWMGVVASSAIKENPKWGDGVKQARKRVI